ncbi:MAG: ABC transporter permease subunit [Planctomycetales bacterium]|nr:ABC transporter permease subunit [Planctomycetales bacterium]
MPAAKSPSLLRLRLRRFRRIKRGYYSFVVLAGAYLGSFFLPFVMGHRPLMVRYEDSWYFPAMRSYVYDTFGLGSSHILPAGVLGQTMVDGQPVPAGAEADYRGLQRQYAAEGAGNWVLMPFFPWSPYEKIAETGTPPAPPMAHHWMGTDTAGRDVFIRLAYGYRVSITFALVVVLVAYTIGTLVGAFLGYFGRWLDMVGLRLVEIWSAIPFLYTVMILASLFRPNFALLVAILSVFGWMTITYYVRGEFYREKAKDYVQAAIAVGEPHAAIMVKHILPNALTPIIAFAPFAIVGTIGALVSLDFLGFGLPAPTPSWGELLRQAKDSGFTKWHLVVFPLGILFVTLQLIVFIGEAVREAFDPKVYSRLR